MQYKSEQCIDLWGRRAWGYGIKTLMNYVQLDIAVLHAEAFSFFYEDLYGWRFQGHPQSGYGTLHVP